MYHKSNKFKICLKGYDNVFRLLLYIQSAFDMQNRGHLTLTMTVCNDITHAKLEAS